MKPTIYPNTENLIRFSWFFFRSYFRWVVLFVFCAILAGLMLPLESYLQKTLIDLLSQTDAGKSSFKEIIFSAIGILLAGQAHMSCWRMLNVVKLKTAPLIKNNIINYAFSYAHKQSYQFFQNNFGGTISHNITTLSDKIENLAYDHSAHMIRGTTQTIVALILMYFVNPLFSIALFVYVLVFIMISTPFIKRMTLYSDEYAESQSIVSGVIVDSVGNFSNVKIFGAEEYEQSYLQKSLSVLRKRFCNKEWFTTKLNYMQGLVVTGLFGFMLFMLVKLKLSNLITIGDFVLIFSLTNYVVDNIWWLTESIGNINAAIGTCKQSLKAIFSPIEILDKADASFLNVTNGEIVFDNVHFQYRGNIKFFENKSIVIHSGQKVGLVGYSGSGKSTFVNLILRLYNIDEGAIIIDQQNISDVTQDSLHKSIGMIPQDPSLFHRSLMENIRYGCESSSDNEVIEAAKKAHAHEFIKKLPEKYQSLVGERGIKLSVGQRQRIAIARAILKNAPILILDEATSALDSVIEQEIQESLSELMKNKTTIVVAHRLSTLLHMDRILVFDEGKIVEDGTHEDLLNKDGLYKTLWNAQVGGFLPDIKDEINSEK